ncbi:hypothetical protein [Streptomyces mirabilis]|uniref:hypothetical protein n=1 Tax=Streptomyces mirabilis TaxID=68239 RepID=UPI0036780FCA
MQGRTGKRARKRLQRKGARLVLGLAHVERLLAVIGVVPEMHDAARALVPAAHAAGLRVVAAGTHTAATCLGDADAVSAGGDRLLESVRALQRDGDGVLLLSHHRPALQAADVGVGVADRQGRPPWGADLRRMTAGTT